MENPEFDRTDEIEAKENEYSIGDRVRILKKKILFETHQTNYSEDTFLITKVNKNSVDVENDKDVFKNVKKKWLQLIEGVKNDNPTTDKYDVEHYSKVKRGLKKAGL